MSRPGRRALAAALAAALVALWALTAAPRGGPPEPLIVHWGLGTFLQDAAATWCTAWIVLALLGGELRATLRRAAAATAGVVALVALLELPAWLGWVDYGRRLGLPQHLLQTRVKPWENPGNVRDPELLYRHRPGERFRGWTEGDLVQRFGIATDRAYFTDVGYDRNGFRNPTDLDAAAIAVIGDSFVEGALVAQGELLSARLAAALGAPVANLGVAGYGPQQELVVLERYALPLGVRRVVWLFFEGNDLSDAERYERARADPNLLNPEVRPSLQRSLTWNALGRLAQLTRRRRTLDSDYARARSGRVQTGAELGQSMYFAVPLRPLDERALEELGLVETVLERAAERCRAAGAVLVIAFAPLKLRVYADLCAFPADFAFGAREPSDLPQRLARFAAGIGVPFVDLTPELCAAASRGELVYFLDDGHWTAAGNAVAARCLLGVLGALEREASDR
jgi:GDSL-like Lipase/Acylhydrolase family